MANTEPKKPRAKFVRVEANPVPDDGKVGYVETPDGARIRYGVWKSALRPSKGTVLILQGRAEFIEKYFETVRDLQERGFGVISFDWRGQGGSSRLLNDPIKGHIENFDQYLVDLETIISEVALPDCTAPFYFLGHSTGGLIGLLAAPALGNRIRRMVLCSPLIALRNLPIKQETVQRIGGVLSFVGLGRSSVSWGGRSNRARSFVGNNLTSDTARFDRNGKIVEANPDLSISNPTVSWVFSACRAMEQLQDPGILSAINIPTLLIAAGNDRVVSPQAVERFGDRLRSGAYLTIFGAKHEILQERDVYREQLLAAFDAFVPGTEV